MNQSKESLLFSRIDKAVSGAVNIVIPLKRSYTSDEFGTALLLQRILKKQNKKITIVLPKKNNAIDLQYRFLMVKDDKLASEFSRSEGYKIVFDTSKVHLGRATNNALKNTQEILFSYQGDELKNSDDKIPELDQFVSLKKVPTTVDLIICLGAQDISQYDLFSEFQPGVIVLNIDNNIDNTNFGNINAVFPTYFSVSHLIFSWLTAKNIDITSEDSTLILSGIIEKTNSFYVPTINAELYLVTARLLELGADKDNIIKNLYKTKSEPLLKIIGKAMLKVKEIPPETNRNGIYIQFNLKDFRRTINYSKAAKLVLQEMIRNFDLGELIVIIYQESVQKYGAWYYTKDTGSISSVEFRTGGDPLLKVLKVI